MIGFGRSWGKTILILLAASLVLAGSSIYMAEQLLEFSLDQEYLHFLSIQRENSCFEQPFDDGMYREDVRNASAGRKVIFSSWYFREEHS